MSRKEFKGRMDALIGFKGNGTLAESPMKTIGGTRVALGALKSAFPA